MRRDLQQWVLADGQGFSNTRVALVFEDGDLGKGKLRQRLEEDGFAVNFAPKKDTMKNGLVETGFVSLQTADMLAYEMLLAAKRENVDRWAANQLMHMPGRIGIYVAEDIKDLERDLRGLPRGF